MNVVCSRGLASSLAAFVVVAATSIAPRQASAASPPYVYDGNWSGYEQAAAYPYAYAAPVRSYPGRHSYAPNYPVPHRSVAPASALNSSMSWYYYTGWGGPCCGPVGEMQLYSGY